jgi:CSLREA domain-containing protein
MLRRPTANPDLHGALPRSHALALTLAVALGAILALSPSGATPARALGVAIEVNTAADTEAADGYCSLREAIYASNGGGYLDCNGSTSADSIRFSIGTGVPVITLGSALPDITQQVTIRGNTGGATRVKLDGGGLIVRNAANGTYIGSMVMRGIYIDGADNVTIVGNVLSSVNGGGNVSNLRIGGSNPRTPEPCSGECNLIIGNANGDGIYFGSTDGTIKGNFIGVDASGNAAAPNRTGILITSGAFTIGGTTADERNVISGNTRDGMVLHACTCIVQGNYIGTNAAGTAAIPNGENGIELDASNATVGGSVAGAGNVISGNLGDGIFAQNSESYSHIAIDGNRIGIKATGGALGNGGAGVHLGESTSLQNPGVEDATIGSATTPSAANFIAYNSGPGVRMNGSRVRYNAVRGNSIHHNGAEGIALEANANSSIAPPTITSAAPLGGTACANCVVDIYSDSADEGQIFEGTVTADGAGNWSYPYPVGGPRVTATNTKSDQAANAWTSEFSAPVTLPQPKKPDGRIRKGSGLLVGNNVYNLTGANQTRTGSAARGSRITFGISIQNDSSSDSFTVRATGTTTTQYSVKYLRGTTDITAAVVAGTYTTPVLGPGGKFLIKAKVTVLNSATLGSSVTRLVTISSVGDSSRKDSVKLVGKRS